MTDHQSTVDRLPGLRLVVTYAATDGTMPEAVEAEWRDAPDPADVFALVNSLVQLPADRLTMHRSHWSDPTPAEVGR